MTPGWLTGPCWMPRVVTVLVVVRVVGVIVELARRGVGWTSV